MWQVHLWGPKTHCVRWENLKTWLPAKKCLLATCDPAKRSSIDQRFRILANYFSYSVHLTYVACGRRQTPLPSRVSLLPCRSICPRHWYRLIQWYNCLAPFALSADELLPSVATTSTSPVGNDHMQTSISFYYDAIFVYLSLPMERGELAEICTLTSAF